MQATLKAAIAFNGLRDLGKDMAQCWLLIRRMWRVRTRQRGPLFIEAEWAVVKKR